MIDGKNCQKGNQVIEIKIKIYFDNILYEIVKYTGLLFVLLSYFCGIIFECYDYISGISTYLIYTKPEKGGKANSNFNSWKDEI